MKLHRVTSPTSEAWSFGVDIQKVGGYNKVLSASFWRWQWVLEFGKGDGYDWEDEW